LGQILPHVQEDRIIGLEDLPAFIQLLDTAFGDTDRVATAAQKMGEIQHKNAVCSQYYAEFHVIPADFDWNHSALRNASSMGLSEEIQDSFTYRDLPDELPPVLSVWKKQYNRIQQRRAEKAAPTTGGGTCFPTAPRPLAPLKDPAGAPGGSAAGYTGPAPMDPSAGRRRISVEERAKRFTDGRCLNCGRLNHRVEECAARKKAQTFKAAGAEVKDVGTGTGSDELGKEQDN